MKKMNFRNLKIGKKYGLTLTFVFILFGIATVIVTGLLYKVGNDVKDLQRRSDLAIDITEMGSITRSKSIRITQYIEEGNSQYVDEFTERREKFNTFEADVRSKIQSKEDMTLFNQVIQLDKAMNDLFMDGVVPAAESGNLDEARRLAKQADGIRSNTVDVLYELRDNVNEQRADAVTMVNTNQEKTFYTLVLSMLVAMIIGGSSVFFISRRVTKNLTRVVEMSNEMAGGNLTVEPVDYDGKDEIGQLATAVNAMGKSLRTMMTHIIDISETLSSQSEELTQSAEEVKAGSEQVASTMEELALGSETQAHNASTLSGKMEIFSEQMEEANTNGKEVVISSTDVLSKTGEGKQLMNQSVKQMSVIDEIVQDAVSKVQGLDHQTKEVTKLVSIIKDVAEQTNLLALNAAIEAARAGEDGRGFAVVAEEVRKLAEQVSRSVEDITLIVGSIQKESSDVADSLEEGYKEVEKGTHQIKTTGETFETISYQVNGMADRIQTVTTNLATMSAGTQEMMASIQEIASLSEEAAAGVEQTSASTQQTSSSMEEVAGSSEQLAKLAQELTGLVRKFQV
ncbi:methyl-accepting chemotaxis protein [Rossellomorea vietnamensis]|uniref:Methyl-accepting chemotaxis protein n=1 Tax=Rossellomorea vietnamensis TaxID=218284 RepID=A0ACD4CCC8_9BACI|nr:methyl-accepting chemotaxis protein [Rossellomorea vietnamensis]UXH46281.1 methyl-accepting chemotaxis protein [Rossellomorea vietnamensis]